MVKLTRFLFLSLAVLLITTALTACSSAGETPVSGSTVPGISVSITDSVCPSIEISVNDQVTWANEDSVEHPFRVEYSDGETMIDLGVLQPGDSASVTFPQAGNFSYFCSIDPESTGTVTVQP
ncbi:MAG: hypothetical protein EHM41_21290 [Chloroflexi bacterium]|nr:MAG: hypothetical protein EHM41_21290 [Chloroflexota bacterium]